MTAAAWWMLALTWTVIAVFTVRFFWKVLTLKPAPGELPPVASGEPPAPGARGGSGGK
jgi:hypothetical protein